MTGLDMAATRLTQALDKLETIAQPLAEARARADRDAAEITRLQARVAELEDEARSLAGLAEEVDGRLDGAIAEIRTALGR
jgi:HAMP domain-containing protein